MVSLKPAEMAAPSSAHGMQFSFSIHSTRLMLGLEPMGKEEEAEEEKRGQLRPFLVFKVGFEGRTLRFLESIWPLLISQRPLALVSGNKEGEIRDTVEEVDVLCFWHSSGSESGGGRGKGEGNCKATGLAETPEMELNTVAAGLLTLELLLRHDLIVMVDFLAVLIVVDVLPLLG
uniref:Uncharacterized protein n=1 Tax=Ananas comosus var. bracteatus TaxID=296719 RepID=A0A6V7P1S2_ANACO|nr:unnamed protein product [Ananas comosus var. bracteatus]